MSLSDYRAPTQVVVSKGGQFEVRGLTLDDLAILLRDHLNDIDSIIDIIGKEVTAATAVNVATTHAVKLVREAPGLVARAIAIACNEPDQVDQARKLTMPVQVKAIEMIIGLTFDEAGGPKKFLASLKGLLNGQVLLNQTGLHT